MGNVMAAVVRVYTLDEKMSFHVVSFMKIEDDKIASLDEYWGDDGEAPIWRQEKNIGRPLREEDG